MSHYPQRFNDCNFFDILQLYVELLVLMVVLVLLHLCVLALRAGVERLANKV